MTARDQLVLPKDVRARPKLLPGCKVEGSLDRRGRLVLVPALHEPETRTVSVDPMNQAIGQTAGRTE